MKKYILLCLLCVLCGTSQAQKIRIKTGIEVLKDQKFKCLEGKRIGLITNPTGVDNQMIAFLLSVSSRFRTFTD